MDRLRKHKRDRKVQEVEGSRARNAGSSGGKATRVGRFAYYQGWGLSLGSMSGLLEFMFRELAGPIGGSD